MTSRKQKTLRISSESADIATFPRPSKSTHHHESNAEQKPTKLVMSEKPNSTGKIANRNHLKEQKLHLKNILSSQTFRGACQKSGIAKQSFIAGILFQKCDNFQHSVSISSENQEESDKG